MIVHTCVFVKRTLLGAGGSGAIHEDVVLYDTQLHIDVDTLSPHALYLNV